MPHFIASYFLSILNLFFNLFVITECFGTFYAMLAHNSVVFPFWLCGMYEPKNSHFIRQGWWRLKYNSSAFGYTCHDYHLHHIIFPCQLCWMYKPQNFHSAIVTQIHIFLNNLYTSQLPQVPHACLCWCFHVLHSSLSKSVKCLSCCDAVMCLSEIQGDVCFPGKGWTEQPSLSILFTWNFLKLRDQELSK